MIGENQQMTDLCRLSISVESNLRESGFVRVTATAKIEAAIHIGLATDQEVFARCLIFTVPPYQATKAVVKVM